MELQLRSLDRGSNSVRLSLGVEVVLGRRKELQVTDLMVSRRHCTATLVLDATTTAAAPSATHTDGTHTGTAAGAHTDAAAALPPAEASLGEPRPVVQLQLLRRVFLMRGGQGEVFTLEPPSTVQVRHIWQ